MNTWQRWARTINDFFFGRRLGYEHPTTFRNELNHQCNRILLFASVISLSWLAYIPRDLLLHPEEPGIIALRIGLPLVGLLVFLLHLHPRLRSNGVLLLMIYGSYLELATALLTGLSGGDPAYIGGFLFILMLLSVTPLPRSYTWSLLGLSLVTFLVVSLGYKKIDLSSPQLQYSLNDLANVAIVDFVFIYIMDKIRYRTWQKSKMIEEQNQEILADKKKIDELLLNIFPENIAREMKQNGTVEPVYFDSVTVVFTDFAGFTEIAEQMSPGSLVSELDRSFSHFDSIMEKYGLEKLKTIGDSYMYAGGIPVPNHTHAIDALLAALEIREYIKKINARKRALNEPFWDLRIGINTGSIMTGVVGKKKYVYDIWGDAVNTASRIESTSAIGMINVSESTYENTQEFFEFHSRGKVLAKSKGRIQMYALNRIREDLAKDDKGTEPNERFWGLYQRLKS